jgi:hypothetical protein
MRGSTISVCVPTRQSVGLFCHTLQGVRGQAKPHRELVAGDDLSADNTLVVVAHALRNMTSEKDHMPLKFPLRPLLLDRPHTWSSEEHRVLRDMRPPLSLLGRTCYA